MKNKNLVLDDINGEVQAFRNIYKREAFLQELPMNTHMTFIASSWNVLRLSLKI